MYEVINENGTVSFDVEFREFDDGEQVFIDAEFKFDPIHIDDWEEFKKMVEEIDLWKDNLNQVATAAKGNDWIITVTKGLYFTCNENDGHLIDLGTLAECYDDCDECDICHNWEVRQNVMEWEENLDNPYCDYDVGYSQYEGCRYHCSGCDAHPCTKHNGRKELMKNLKLQTPL